MTEPRTLLLNISHRLTHPGLVQTYIDLPDAVISIAVSRDIDPAAKADLCALLGNLAPLMDRVWAQPEQDGPMVYDLRKPADG